MVHEFLESVCSILMGLWQRHLAWIHENLGTISQFSTWFETASRYVWRECMIVWNKKQSCIRSYDSRSCYSTWAYDKCMNSWKSGNYKISHNFRYNLKLHQDMYDVYGWLYKIRSFHAFVNQYNIDL